MPRGNRNAMEGRKFSMKKPGLRSVQRGKPAVRTRRNYTRIFAVAEHEVAAHGAGA
jgi:hypothetical protein